MTQQEKIDKLLSLKGLIRKIAHKRSGLVDREDLEQIGTIEAINIINKWDGVKPIGSYLYQCIDGRILNETRNQKLRQCSPLIVDQPMLENNNDEWWEDNTIDLTLEQKEVIRSLYREKMTMMETAKQMKCGRVKIRKLHNEALDLIKDRIRRIK